jgi:hypothetical protein
MLTFAVSDLYTAGLLILFELEVLQLVYQLLDEAQARSIMILSELKAPSSMLKIRLSSPERACQCRKRKVTIIPATPHNSPQTPLIGQRLGE